MLKKSLAEELSSTTYPGRGIVIGRTPDGNKAVLVTSKFRLSVPISEE